MNAASTSLNKKYTLVAANDVVLDSSAMKFSPTDCQRPEVFNKNMVKGNILLCGYSFNFVMGTSSVKKVAETAKSLGAIGFVLAVESVSPGTKFEPVASGMPGIIITDVDKSMVFKLLFVCKLLWSLISLSGFIFGPLPFHLMI